jgi:hypothetical protein
LQTEKENVGVCVAEAVLTVGSVRGEMCTHRGEIDCIARATPKTPISKLHAHRNLSSSAHSSAPCKDRIDVGHIRLVVDDEATHFYPSVCSERQLLNADHQLSGEAVRFQEARRCRRPLQAKDPAEVEDGRQVDCLTDFRATKRFLRSQGDRSSSNAIVDCRKGVPKERIFQA